MGGQCRKDRARVVALLADIVACSTGVLCSSTTWIINSLSETSNQSVHQLSRCGTAGTRPIVVIASAAAIPAAAAVARNTTNDKN